MVSQDQLCGRYKDYGKSMRLNRQCDINKESVGNVHVQCNLLSQKFFHDVSVEYLYKLGILDSKDAPPKYLQEDKRFKDSNPTKRQKEERDRIRRSRLSDLRTFFQNYSHHPHISAFADVDFGKNSRGILGATPSDMMHAFLHGVLPRTIKAY